MEKVLSISVAAYNMENYIRDTLNSVVNSDVKDLVEVIVVDDESTDNTVKIVEEYISEYPNVIKLIKQKNQGPGSTFNAALKVATGKYIKMVDADDFVNEESLNYVVNQLKNIDCDMVLTKMDYFDDAEKKVYFTAELGYEADTVMDTINYDYIPEMNAISYRTKILQDNNIKLSNGFYTDMEYVIFPLLFVNSFIYFNKNLYVYRTGRAGQSTSIEGYQKHLKQHDYIFRELLSFFRDNYYSFNDTVRVSIDNRLIYMAEAEIDTLLSFENVDIDNIKEFINFIKSIDYDFYIELKDYLLNARKINIEEYEEENNQLPLISIIIPFYNCENYLVRCLDSVASQTYNNLEIILVNDGSTDNSLEICERYLENDSRIKIINKEHGGVASARNAGLDAVTGEYIGFVDSDDYINENMYMELYNALIHNNCDVATCNFYRVYGEDYFVDYTFPYKNIILNREEAIKSILLDKELRVYLWTKLFPKKAFENVRFPEGREYEDIDVSIKTLENVDSIIFLNKFFYNYVNRVDSIDNNYDEKNVKDSIEMAYFRYKYVKDNYNDLLLYNVISLIERFHYTYINIDDYDLLKEYIYVIKELNDDIKLLNVDDIVFETGEVIWENYLNINQLLEIDN